MCAFPSSSWARGLIAFCCAFPRTFRINRLLAEKERVTKSGTTLREDTGEESWSSINPIRWSWAFQPLETWPCLHWVLICFSVSHKLIVFFFNNKVRRTLKKLCVHASIFMWLVYACVIKCACLCTWRVETYVSYLSQLFHIIFWGRSLTLEFINWLDGGPVCLSSSLRQC